MSEIVVESELHRGLLECECIIRKADGTIKSIERSTRPVSFKLDQGDQVTEIKEDT